jgi:hypothetical protein
MPKGQVGGDGESKVGVAWRLAVDGERDYGPLVLVV